MPSQPKGAIVGLGVTPMGKIYGRRAVDFAAEAIALALDDAGLTKNDVDGLLINANISGDMDVRSQMILGFENLRAWFARRFRRPDPGRVNLLKVLPVAYVVVAAFVALSALLVYAGITNPIQGT